MKVALQGRFNGVSNPHLKRGVIDDSTFFFYMIKNLSFNWSHDMGTLSHDQKYINYAF
jgi:hypothetical protein